MSERVLDQNAPNNYFSHTDLIPNRIFLTFARPKWTKMVHLGPFWPKEVYFGPLGSANRTLAAPDKARSLKNDLPVDSCDCQEKASENPRGIFLNKVVGEFCGRFFGGFFRASLGNGN